MHALRVIALTLVLSIEASTRYARLGDSQADNSDPLPLCRFAVVA